MFVIDPSHEILANHISPELIEIAGRTCYKSEPKGNPDKFIEMIQKRGHESVLEHSMLTVRFVTNRGVSHELVRHRLAAFSQESTRYVNYEKKGLVVIRPVWCDERLLGGAPEHPAKFSDEDARWLLAMYDAENAYNQLIERGWRPEQAREVLPNSTKTEIVITANAREWRHIFRMRMAKAAHPEMQRIIIPLFHELRTLPCKVLFDDLLSVFE